MKWLTLTDNCADEIGGGLPVLRPPVGAFCKLCTLHVDATIAEPGIFDALSTGSFPLLTALTARGGTSPPDRADAIQETCRARKIQYNCF